MDMDREALSLWLKLEARETMLYQEGEFTHVIRASHSKKFSSLIGPATMPSGGFKVSSGDRWKQLLSEVMK